MSRTRLASLILPASLALAGTAGAGTLRCDGDLFDTDGRLERIEDRM